MQRVPVKTVASRAVWNYPGWFYRSTTPEGSGWTVDNQHDVTLAFLPRVWFRLVEGTREVWWDCWRCRVSCREVEDAAAVAFAALSPSYKCYYLSGKWKGPQWIRSSPKTSAS